MTDLINRNRRSLRALCISINSEIELKRNPKTGKLFFTCGTNAAAQAAGFNPTPKPGETTVQPEDSFTIYGSPKAIARFQEPTATVADFQFAESSKDGVHFVPTLMIVGEKSAPIKSLGSELLH